jgi:hypothetical protein
MRLPTTFLVFNGFLEGLKRYYTLSFSPPAAVRSALAYLLTFSIERSGGTEHNFVSLFSGPRLSIF